MKCSRLTGNRIAEFISGDKFATGNRTRNQTHRHNTNVKTAGTRSANFFPKAKWKWLCFHYYTMSQKHGNMFRKFKKIEFLIRGYATPQPESAQESVYIFYLRAQLHFSGMQMRVKSWFKAHQLTTIVHFLHRLHIFYYRLTEVTVSLYIKSYPKNFI